MSLFEQIVRTDEGPAKHLHNSYDFYNTNARAEIGAIRDLLNTWFDSYPAEFQPELRKRFRKDFSPPFFELFVHELFRTQGFKLQPHPQLAWSTKRPEFLVTGKASEFYVEAKEVIGKSDTERAADNMASALYDQINQVKSDNFLVWIRELLLKSGNQPSGKAVIRFLQQHLLLHDPELVHSRLLYLGLLGATDLLYEDEDLKLTFSLMPKSSEARGKEGRLIGAYPGVSYVGTGDRRLRLAISEKASKYGSFDRPFVICVNVVGDDIPDDDDVFNALFGTLKYTVSIDPSNRDIRPSRDSDGVFINSTSTSGRNVSAVLITRLFPSNLHKAKHWFVKNPNARHELDLDAIMLTRLELAGSEISQIAGKTIHELFDLSESWLD